jgi:hypothetical protein
MPLSFGSDPSKIMLPLQVDANGYLRVVLEAGSNLAGEVSADGYGWIGGDWQKAPLPFGYSGDWSEQVNGTGTGGADTLLGTQVPAGEIWIVQAIAAVNASAVTTSTVSIYATVNGVNVILNQVATPAAGSYVLWSGAIVLSENDRISALFSNTTGANNIQLRYHAVRVDIDQ